MVHTAQPTLSSLHRSRGVTDTGETDAELRAYQLRICRVHDTLRAASWPFCCDGLPLHDPRSVSLSWDRETPMPLEPPILERRSLGHTRGVNRTRQAQEAARHQYRALASLARVREHASGTVTRDRRTDLLREALYEAVSARRLLQHAQQAVSTRAAAAQVGRRLGQVSALAEDIERELYEPAGLGPQRSPRA
jgi:hypothetical protein